MNIVTALVLILCGIFAAAAFAARLQPDRRAAVDALAFFQGIVGLPAAAWGVWVLIVSADRLYQIRTNPVFWATFLGTGVFEVVLGLLLGAALLGRGSKLTQRLSVVEIPLGLLAIAAGFWCYAAVFLFHEI